MGYYKWADQQLKDLLAKNPTYTRSQYPGMQLAMANNTLNSRIPGADQFGRNIMSSGQTSFNNASKYATDASQLLGANAGIQGQTDQQLGDLQLQEADWKKFGLGQLNDAYKQMFGQDQYMNELDQQKYQNEVALRGAQAANKLGKRKALWNTVGSVANAVVGVASGGLIKNVFGNKSGGTNTNWTVGSNPSNAGAQPSDIRLKENYYVVGKSPSGINIYEFSYLNNNKRYQGVMAHEVPFAAKEMDGYLFVDYSKTDVQFKEI